MRKMIGVFLVLTCCLTVCLAQQQKTHTPEKWDIFVGYSLSRAYLTDFEGAPFPMNLNGGQASGTRYFSKHLGATAEIAGYTNDQDEETFSTQGYLFGPTARFGAKDSRMSFFVHQLFGFTHLTITPDNGSTCNGTSKSCTNNAFTTASGGGMDVSLTRHISLRPAQLEYFNEHVSPDALGGGSSLGGLKLTLYGFRYSAGAVIRF